MQLIWSFPKKLGFLFLSIYFFLYCNSNQFLLSFAFHKLWKIIVPWFAKVLGREEAITIFPAGSGDTTYNYYEILFFAVIAVLLSIIIATLDRKRANYNTLLTWFTLLLRYYLAAQMISYGLAKLFYMQFSFPSAARFDQQLGDFSPMGLLWTFMGYSKAYTMFTGAMEFIGGILLLSRYTTTIGALTTFGVMVNVMMLNYCYDVPVKLLSSHLVLMSVILILFDADRLFKFFFTNEQTKPRILRSVANEQQQKITTRFKWIVIILYLAYSIYQMIQASKIYGPSAEKPFLHGKHLVEKFQRFDEGIKLDPVPPGLDWKIIYQHWEGFASMKIGNEKMIRYNLNVDTTNQVLSFNDTASGDTIYHDFKYIPIGESSYKVSGFYYNDSLDFVLKKVSLNEHLLVSRGFNWINEYPFNR